LEPTYDAVTASLRASYDRGADERERNSPETWKQDERREFLGLLQAEQRLTLLEIGSGPGKDSLYFQEQGLDVTCTDLSPAMVELCQQKGLRAYVRDFLHLELPPASFDAVYALNCLLHVPKRDLPAVLESIQQLLVPGGLFFLGLWGGRDSEQVWEGDSYEPKRFFSFHTDAGIRSAVQPYFEEVSFRTLTVSPSPDLHFQRLILRHRAR
jgi:SAM-dependent methyltransferase